MVMYPNEIEILFAEDSIDDADLTIRALRKSGFGNNIHHVKDGVEALEYLYRKGRYEGRTGPNPKMILLDLKMPLVPGMMVLERVKSDPDLKTIPVIILTSSKEDPDVQKCYGLGANSYIVKPVESDNFFHAVKEIGLYWIVLSQLPR